MIVRIGPEIQSTGSNGPGESGVALLRDDFPIPQPRNAFVRSLGKALAERCNRRKGARLVVAVSGGADSLALLAGLITLARKRHRNYEIIVGHVQHHFRDEAEDQAQSVAQLCQRVEVAFARRDVWPGREQTGNTSAIARRMRYEALGDIAREYDAECVLTAHHGTDLLESVLLNVIRGTGLAGLGAMTWQSQLFGVTVCRPLLDQNRRDCEALCRSIGWHWFDDPLNSVLAQKRNRIRADILPTLFELSPDLDRRIHRLSDQAQAAHDLIARLANQSAGCAPASSYERDQFTKLDRLVLGATLRAIGIAHGVSPDLLTLNVLDPLMGAIQSNDRKRREFAWPGGIRMILEADQLLVRHEDDGCDERMMSSE